MNIKEVEQEVGIKKANIRYYEEQGLITPRRRAENSYRDYSKEDILCLKKIKMLRLLGVSVADIKSIQKDERSLRETVSERMLTLEDEIIQLEELKAACQILLEQGETYDGLDPSLLDMRWSLSLKKGEAFMKIDRCKNYKEAYHRSTMILTFFALLVMLPTSGNLQQLLHYSLPEWMRWLGIGGTWIAGGVSVVCYMLMNRQKRRDWEKGEERLEARMKR